MRTIQTRFAVLGAGAMGTAAAYCLARLGEPVTLVEQFVAGHDRGSSHGDARIIRHSYADPRYARLMSAAFQAWREVEADAGRPLVIRTGGVSFNPPSLDYSDRVAANLAANGVANRLMSGRDWCRASPAFMLPDDYRVIFEPDAGLVAAARAMTTQLELARQHGGDRFEFLENCPIRRIDFEAERPTLVADRLRIVAERLIVAAGSWIGSLLPRLAPTLQPTRQRVLYFQPARSLPFQIGSIPVFISMGEGEQNAYYGMPSFLGSGVKVARHGGPPVDPDVPIREIEPEYEDEIRQFLRAFLPALADASVIRREVCLYTVSPGEDFLIGPLPGRPEVILASPCSGHGFKFSALIGRSLADLARSGECGLDLTDWLPHVVD